MFSLLDVAAGEATETVVVCQTAGPVRLVAGGCVGKEGYFREAAGRAFFEHYEARSSTQTKKGGKGKDAADESTSDGEEYTGKGGKDKDREKTGATLKLSPLLKDVELYPLMGVSEGASQDEIKKAYRALALACHPDKMGQLSEDEAKKVQENFVKIQEAYEILSDPSKRQLYDSSLPFDESLPKFKDGDGQDFYEVFGEVFKRNARFSTKRPVPDIGGPETSLQDVKKFYDFWFGFASWRDPLVMAQADGHELHELEEAECREEKRWMIRENQRIGKKYKQAEKERICQLASLAERNDPRLIAEKEAKKAARAAEAARKEAEKMAVQRAREEEERKQKEAEEAARFAEAEKRKAEKEKKDAERAQVKKQRTRIRSFHPQVKQEVEMEQLNEVCLQFDRAALQQLGDEVQKAIKGKDGVAQATKLLYAAIESLGLKPVKPVYEDDVSTSTDSPIVESPVIEETPEMIAARARKEEQRRKAEEERRKVEEAERAVAAEKAAEDRRRREEQRKKEEAAAESKRRQQEKKEKEKAKKDAEKKIKKEQEEQVRREQQREEAKKKAQEQAEKDRAAAAAEQEEREQERVSKLFDEDRRERLAALETLSDAQLKEELEAAHAGDASLRGSLHLLKSSPLDEDQRKNLLMVLVMGVGPVWPLALDPPSGVKPPVASTRNQAKKARNRLRDVALRFSASLSANAGAADADQVNATQRGFIDGKFEWPTWTVEEREAELAARGNVAAPAETTPTAAATETKAAPATGGKKGKKAKEAKEEKPEEDLDALFAEFGVAIQPKNGKKKSKK